MTWWLLGWMDGIDEGLDFLLRNESAKAGGFSALTMGVDDGDKWTAKRPGLNAAGAEVGCQRIVPTA